MSGLVHISKYLNEYKIELDKYDQELTRRAEEVSNQVRMIQEEFTKLNVEPFYYGWSEEDEEYSFGMSLGWSGSKVVFRFEDNEPEVLLGSNRDIRVSVEKRIVPFLERGFSNIRSKTESLNK